MSKPVTITYTFATQTGKVPASELDSNYSALAASVNDLATYLNYVADVGSVNNVVLVFSAPLTVTSYTNLEVAFTVIATNTGATVININGLGAVPLVRPDGTALQASDMIVNNVYKAVYNANSNSFQLTTSLATSSVPSSISTLNVTVSLTATGTLTGFPFLYGLTASIGSNALTTVSAACSVLFRNATAGNGGVVPLAVASLSITIPSGATLGSVNATQSIFAYLIAYNAGTPVLCVCNAAGGIDLSESGFISPTTISAGATSSTTIYSASSVSANSPYKLVGYSVQTEATAGTYATAPSLVQGIGGQAVLNLPKNSITRLNTPNGAGSTNTHYRRFTNIVTNQGPDITYADSATLGASFTVNNAGIYAISYSDAFGTSTPMAITLNDNQPTAAMSATTITAILATCSTSASGQFSNCFWTGYLPNGSVINCKCDSSGNSTAQSTQFTMTRVS